MNGFIDLRRTHDPGNRLPQRVAEQRVIIGNDKMGACRHFFFLRDAPTAPSLLPGFQRRELSVLH